MAWFAKTVPTVVRISIAIVVVLMVGTYEVRPELVFESSDCLHKIYALPQPALTDPAKLDGFLDYSCCQESSKILEFSKMSGRRV